MSARVMIVEDEALIALFLEDALDGTAYEVGGMVAGGNEALALAATQWFDVALVDLGLADGLAGDALARRLSDEHGIRCILLTGHIVDPDRLARSGAVAALIKPVAIKDLLSVLARTCPVDPPSVALPA